MVIKIVLYLIVVFAAESWANNKNFTFTYSMASKCKEHICRRGYVYDTFYEIDEANLRHAIVKVDNEEVSYFEMHIAIQAPSNGHILLSTTERPGLKDPVYEIVVGGGGNKFSELRLNQKTNARGTAKTPGILSAIEFTAFYIRISDDGLVEFGKEGDSTPLLHFYDAQTMPVRYFSFASWSGVEAKFLYDCPDPNSNAKRPDSHMVAPRLSKSDELKRSLLLTRLPSIPPSPKVVVHLGVRVTHVKYDALDTKMRSRIAVVMNWFDDTMAWNPIKYNGTTSIRFRQGMIWRPKFFAFNSDGTDPLDTKNPDMLTVKYNGEASFHFQTELTTWCRVTDESYLNKWPHDQYSCMIVIEPWEVHEKISIVIMDPKDDKMAVFSDMDKIIPSEWEWSYSQWVAKGYVWNTIFTHTDNATHQSDRLVIDVQLARNATAYNIVFYTPLLVLVTFVLMSFWSEPVSLSRVWFTAGCAVVICTALSYINFMVPTHTVPSIMILYITIMFEVLLALLVQVALMTATADRICKSYYMHNLLTFPMLRTTFCLPPMKISLSGEYSQQEDEESAAGLVNEENHNRSEKHDLAEILDKAMFFVYFIIVAGMLAAHY